MVLLLLAVDVGNTNIVMGVFKGKDLVAHWRLSTNRDRTSDETGIFLLSMLSNLNINKKDIKAVIICSVVPPIMHSFINAIKKYVELQPILVEPGLKTGINIKYENPREVGADRIVNAVAALKLYGGPCIIVDFGTATTFCSVSKNADYLGGVICPGIKVSAEALFEKTAKLPRIELVRPKTVIGRTTVTSMQSGLIYGYVGQVDFIVKQMMKEMGEKDIKVISTGGLSVLIAPESETITESNRMLTMEGLRILYEMNS